VISYSKPVNLTINTHPDYLQTIMQNLTANAIKALQKTTNGAIERKAWEEKGEIYFSITDNGPGINSEQAKVLFDETYVMGTRHGLGLHIVRDLAKAITCGIAVATENKPGTTFVLAI
jgi:C4-dicarboxylate-specific signal transduction histidine kinase